MTMMNLTVSAVAGAILASATMAPPASAVTLEVAKTCRALMVKAYPPKPAGTSAGNAEEQRNYFKTCLALGGKMGNSPGSTVGQGK